MATWPRQNRCHVDEEPLLFCLRAYLALRHSVNRFFSHHARHLGTAQSCQTPGKAIAICTCHIWEIHP